MKRFLFALLILPLLCAAAFAAAESPATDTDLCAHLNVQTVYYFDAPDYRPLNAENHMVVGRASVQEVCADCGQVLSVREEDDAEEIRPHVFHKGKCALCGREEEAQQKAAGPRAEEVVILVAADGRPSQYFCTLTLGDLEEAGETIVLRPDGCDTAIVIQTDRLREEIERTGGTFTAEIEQPGDNRVSASLRVYDGNGGETEAESAGISLRIYEENSGSPLTVSYTDPAGATSTEEASWVNRGDSGGYWIVTWQGDGSYIY